MKLTPVLIVDDIESCLPFWIGRVGFEKTVDVPDGDRLAFVILTCRGAEVMLQTRASVRRDAPALAPEGPATGASLFVEVEDFADMRRRLEGYPIVLPERTTFYGMVEIGVRDPGGHLVVFAARV
jgi:uncharacterized glyoxalase superfamily protein PhnB